MVAETALPGCAGRFSAIRKPQMRVFGAKPPPVQPPQGRSGKFRTRFSPVTTGAAGQSSGSRSPKSGASRCTSSPDPDSEPCRSRAPARDPERMLHPHPSLRRLRPGRGAARRQRPALARGHGNLSRNIAMRVLRTLADPAVSRVTPDLLLLAVQKLARRRQVATLAAVPSRWRTRPRGSVPMCSFIPKCHRFPFLVWCISGSWALLSLLVDDGAETMVASTMAPFFSKTPRSAR